VIKECEISNLTWCCAREAWQAEWGHHNRECWARAHERWRWALLLSSWMGIHERSQPLPYTDHRGYWRKTAWMVSARSVCAVPAHWSLSHSDPSPPFFTFIHIYERQKYWYLTFNHRLQFTVLRGLTYPIIDFFFFKKKKIIRIVQKLYRSYKRIISLRRFQY